MYIARQPIFNKKQEIYGYELLFRNNIDSNKFDGISSEVSTANVIDNLLVYGIGKITDDRKAFINFDSHVVCAEFMNLLNPDHVVIELLEDIKISEELFIKIKKLKEKGFLIALDDFVEEYKEYELVKYANIIKYDLMETPLGTIKNDVKEALKDRKMLLAEKVETYEEFEMAKSMGFNLFQGYFFSKPSIVKGVRNATKLSPAYLEVLNELQNEEPSYDKITEVIERDANLTYKLLKVINRKAVRNSISSVKRALTFLGIKEINYWVTLLLMQNVSEDKPLELMRISLIRSKFAKEIAVLSNNRGKKSEASLMGLLSNMDVYLQEPLEDILEKIKITEDIKKAVFKEEGILGIIYKMVLFYEKGEWEEVEKMSEKINVNPDILNKFYFKSLEETKQIMDAISKK